MCASSASPALLLNISSPNPTHLVSPGTPTILH
uniref:Uncharacterized protein n=1 Tax=Podoviridae sp. ct8Lf7 TaxID=2827723 RepID=A0A8S5S0Q0_9CAUD|nr:MAG TPA: hypothetical protein [Podoviridae sp. ct8Lf7]